MKTLIIYTTKYGSVAKAVELLRKQIPGEVNAVNLNQDAAPTLEPFDQVILGGSIYFGKTQKGLFQYATTNLSTLLKKRVGLFLCTGEQTTDPGEVFNSNFPGELNTQAIAKALFGGAFNFDQMRFLDKFIARAVSGHTKNHSWLSEEAIRTFAKTMSVS